MSVDEFINLRHLIDQDRDILVLKNICHPLHYTPERATQEDKYNPAITFFNLPPSSDVMLRSLTELQDSMVFKNIWDNYIRSVTRKGTQSLAVVINEVWKTSSECWQDIRKSITAGNVSFDTIDKHFGGFEKNYDLIQKELDFLCQNRRLVEERLTQIKDYHQLERYSRGAVTMLELRDKFELRGDFSTVEVLAGLVSLNFILTKTAIKIIVNFIITVIKY